MFFSLSEYHTSFQKLSALALVFVCLIHSEGFSQPINDELKIEKYAFLALEYHKTMQVDSAVYYYHKVAELYFNNGQNTEYVNTFVDIADLYMSIGDYKNAIQWLDSVYLEPIERFENEDERVALLELHLFKAYAHEQLGNYLLAKEYYEIARLKFIGNTDYEDFVTAQFLYRPLANIYTRLGDYEEALQLLERFKELSLEEGEYNAAAEAFNDIGIIYKVINHSETELIALYEKALELPSLQPKTKGLLLSNLSSVYHETGENKKALTVANSSIFFLEQALKVNDNQKFILAYLSRTYNTLGSIHTFLKNYQKAGQFFKKSLELGIKAYKTGKRREIAKIYVSIGHLSLLKNEPSAALTYYHKALQSVIIDFTDDDVNSNPSVDKIYPENTIFEALEGKIKAYHQLSESNKDIFLLRSAHYCYELIFEVEFLLRKNYRNESAKLLLIAESHRRSERAIDLSYELHQITGEQVFKEKAFAFIEKNKAIILLESLQNLRIKDFSNIPDSTLALEETFKSNLSFYRKAIHEEKFKGKSSDLEKINRLEDQIFVTKSKLNKLNHWFEENFQNYYDLRNDDQIQLNLKKIKASIVNDKNQIIEYFVGSEHIFVFSIDKDTTDLIRIDKTEDLQKSINDVLKSVSQQNLMKTDISVFSNASGKLYQALLAPVISEKPELIIIPGGNLGYIPFDILLVDGVKNNNLLNYKHLPYLIKSKTISYAFSINTLLQNIKQADNAEIKSPFVGIAPIFKSSKTFTHLPFSQKEVETLQQQLGGDIFTDHLATKAYFKANAGKYQIIHLSSHAAVLDSLPLYSWISFSDQESDNENDYKLFLSELYAMRINADLAVLSACETGRGELYHGEGIMSLARGFTYAGCKSIVTTLWPVNDASTSDIMASFYSYLEKGNKKDAALRLAKLDYLQSENIDELGAHPFFWAAYIPIGNMAPLQLDRNNSAIYVLIGAALFLLIFVFLLLKKYKNKTHG